LYEFFGQNFGLSGGWQEGHLRSCLTWISCANLAVEQVWILCKFVFVIN